MHCNRAGQLGVVDIDNRRTAVMITTTMLMLHTSSQAVLSFQQKCRGFLLSYLHLENIFLYLLDCKEDKNDKNAFQLNANHPLADSIGYIKWEGM